MLEIAFVPLKEDRFAKVALHRYLLMSYLQDLVSQVNISLKPWKLERYTLLLFSPAPT